MHVLDERVEPEESRREPFHLEPMTALLLLGQQAMEGVGHLLPHGLALVLLPLLERPGARYPEGLEEIAPVQIHGVTIATLIERGAEGDEIRVDGILGQQHFVTDHLERELRKAPAHSVESLAERVSRPSRWRIPPQQRGQALPQDRPVDMPGEEHEQGVLLLRGQPNTLAALDHGELTQSTESDHRHLPDSAERARNPLRWSR